MRIATRIGILLLLLAVIGRQFMLEREIHFLQGEVVSLADDIKVLSKASIDNSRAIDSHSRAITSLADSVKLVAGLR